MKQERQYGYCRVSTAKQNIERQVRNILAEYPEAIIIKEVYTGTKFQGRVELNKLLKLIRTGDTIIFDSVSRMSRDAVEGFQLYKELFAKGVKLVFLKEPHIDTDTYKNAMDLRLAGIKVATNDEDADGLINGILEAVNIYVLKLAERQIQLVFEQAEKEVEDLHQRTREGIETARLNGKQIGVAAGSKLITKKSIRAKEMIRKYSRDFDGHLNDKECLRLIGISRASYYKYKAALKQEYMVDIQRG